MGNLQPRLEQHSDCASPDHRWTDVGLITAKTSGTGDALLPVPRVLSLQPSSLSDPQFQPLWLLPSLLGRGAGWQKTIGTSSLVIPVVLSSSTLAGALFPL